MNRAERLERALMTYTCGAALPTTPERVTELARYLDDYLAPDTSPRSSKEWARFVADHAAPDLFDVMATELARQGASVRPWEILRGIAQSHAIS